MAFATAVLLTAVAGWGSAGGEITINLLGDRRLERDDVSPLVRHLLDLCPDVTEAAITDTADPLVDHARCDSNPDRLLVITCTDGIWSIAPQGAAPRQVGSCPSAIRSP